MLTVVTRWDTSTVKPRIEWRLWRQLRGAFGFDRFVAVPPLLENEGFKFDQFPTMTRALESCHGRRIFFEPHGPHTLGDIPRGDLVLVFGNTERGNSHHVGSDDYKVRLNSRNAVDLFGANAAAIALNYLYGRG